MTASVYGVLAVLAGAVVLVVLTELQKRHWAAGYFTPVTLLIGFDSTQKPGWLEVIGKAAIPMLAGGFTALSAPSDRPILAAFGALFGSLALSWPILIVRDAMPEEMYGRELELRLLHVMYVATATVLGFGGGLSVEIALKLGAQPLVDFGNSVFQGILAELVVLSVIFVLGSLFTGARMRRSKKLEADAEEWDRRRHGD